MYRVREYKPNSPKPNNQNLRLIAQNDSKPNVTKSNPSLAWQARPPRYKEHRPILSHHGEHTPSPTN
jgi:hypothetical protein